MLRGERPLIRSDGSFTRDYFYVKDGAAAYLHLAERMACDPEIHGHAFNFSTETPMNVLEMTHRILRLMDSPLEPRVLNEASNEIKNQFLSAEKARRMLLWAPSYRVDDALAETVAWYRAFLAPEHEAPARPQAA